MQSGCQDRLIPLKNQTTHQPLVLALTTTEQSLTFAHRFKKKLLTGPVLGEAYKSKDIYHHIACYVTLDDSFIFCSVGKGRRTDR